MTHMSLVLHSTHICYHQFLRLFIEKVKDIEDRITVSKNILDQKFSKTLVLVKSGV